MVEPLRKAGIPKGEKKPLWTGATANGRRPEFTNQPTFYRVKPNRN
jgi:hypothetical protein